MNFFVFGRVGRGWGRRCRVRDEVVDGLSRCLCVTKEGKAESHEITDIEMGTIEYKVSIELLRMCCGVRDLNANDW